MTLRCADRCSNPWATPARTLRHFNTSRPFLDGFAADGQRHASCLLMQVGGNSFCTSRPLLTTERAHLGCKNLLRTEVTGPARLIGCGDMSHGNESAPAERVSRTSQSIEFPVEGPGTVQAATATLTQSAFRGHAKTTTVSETFSVASAGRVRETEESRGAPSRSGPWAPSAMTSRSCYL